MKLVTRLFVSGATVAAFGLVGVLPSACSSDGESGTTGKRIALEAKVTSTDAKGAFTNAVGWSIKLDKVIVSTGALYFFDGATIFSQNDAPKPRWHDAFAIKSAFAHPGHYVPGNARGELLTATSVDLKADASVGNGNGISGITRSATFSFQAPPSGPFAGELGAHVAVLEGTATKGAETRLFRAEMDAADVVNTKNATAVEGCPFAEVDMEADGMVTADLKMAQWFDQADFTAIARSTDGKPVLLGADDGPRKALARGMKEGLSYNFSYKPR